MSATPDGAAAPRRLLARLLSHPLARGRDLDDPATTAARREIIAGKPALARIYAAWYAGLAASVPEGTGPVLELGSGAGFGRAVIERLVTSDVMPVPGIDLVADGRYLPFASASLRGIVMTNVLHHVPEVERFFADAARAVRPGGVMAMIEPWVTPWSSLVYQHLHHEPFVPSASWEVHGRGPLSAANGALPWILFHRDRERFERQYPEWHVASVRPAGAFEYLLTGGLSLRSVVPVWMIETAGAFERRFARVAAACAMFAHIVLVRRRGRVVPIDGLAPEPIVSACSEGAVRTRKAAVMRSHAGLLW